MFHAEGIEIWGENIHQHSVTEEVTQSRKKSHSLRLSTRFSYTHLDLLHVYFAPNRQKTIAAQSIHIFQQRVDP
jgi:hypothetical protein